MHAKTLIAALLLTAAGMTGAAEFNTSFEFSDSDGFVLGEAPLIATFANGVAEARGTPALYSSGNYAWFISPGDTGVVTFDTPAFETVVNFKGAQGTVRVYDSQDALISATAGTADFQTVTTSRGYGETRIARIEVENMSAEDIAVDDFSFMAEDRGNLITADIQTGAISITLEEVASGFTALPLQANASPIGGDRLYVVDQAGQVHALDITTGQARVFLDVANRLVDINENFDERGLLGFAFHPDYATNGLVYTYTSEPVNGAADFSTLGTGETADHQSVITEWTVNAPADVNASVDTGSARELLRIDQPQANHNGGALAFDADGRLYITLGDGGAGDDQGTGHVPGGNGQNAGNVLGSVLRIDPLAGDSVNGAYGIPPDNPFVGTSPLDEIFATGLRNPFRIHIDTALGEIWLPDVGQHDIEEINLLRAGANYGWNWKEGSYFFDPNGNESGFATALENPAAPTDLVDPVAEYDHSEGIALIGGAVYHGSDIPALEGLFVFGDYFGNSAEGRLFYLQDETVLEFDMPPLGAILTGFGQDADGEIYVLVNASGAPAGSTGTVYRVAPAPGSDDDDANDDGGGGNMPPPNGGGYGGGGGAILFLVLLLPALRKRQDCRP